MNKVNVSLQWVLVRLEEPSTWAGAGIFAVLIHQFLPGDLGNAVIALGGSIGAFLAVIIPEKTP